MVVRGRWRGSGGPRLPVREAMGQEDGRHSRGNTAGDAATVLSGEGRQHTSREHSTTHTCWVSVSHAWDQSDIVCQPHFNVENHRCDALYQEKKQEHRLISVMTEEVIWHNPTNFHDKKHSKNLKIEGRFLNLINDIYGQFKLTLYPMVKAWKLRPRSGTRTSAYCTRIPHCGEGSIWGRRQESEGGIRIGKSKTITTL